MEICIYCARTAPRRFPREHVMPVGFGRFRQNLTIHCVCGECNAFFGNTIERIFEQDSLLGVLRLRHGLKPPAEGHEVGRTRVRTTVREHGLLAGAPVDFGESSTGDLRAHHREDLVGFENLDGTADWFHVNELTEEVVSGYKPWRRMRILARPEHAAVIREHLRSLGATVEDPQPFGVETGTLDVQSVWTVGDDELRVVGKIAFNYAAKILGPGIVLRGDFDKFRRWVRLGESTGRTSVVEHVPPTLIQDAQQQDFHGHLITLSWTGTHSLVANVCFFNSVAFAVELCTHFSGVWRPVESAHSFDLGDRLVTKLRRTRVLFR